jgi:hypothetical protein
MPLAFKFKARIAHYFFLKTARSLGRDRRDEERGNIGDGLKLRLAGLGVGWPIDWQGALVQPGHLWSRRAFT